MTLYAPSDEHDPKCHHTMDAVFADLSVSAASHGDKMYRVPRVQAIQSSTTNAKDQVDYLTSQLFKDQSFFTCKNMLTALQNRDFLNPQKVVNPENKNKIVRFIWTNWF